MLSKWQWLNDLTDINPELGDQMAIHSGALQGAELQRWLGENGAQCETALDHVKPLIVLYQAISDLLERYPEVELPFIQSIREKLHPDRVITGFLIGYWAARRET